MRTQIRRLIPALSARLREEAGMSLVLALGFMTIFSLTTAAIVNELVLNDTGARRDQKMVSALASAEAEMNFASQWVLKNDFNDTLAVGTTYPHSTDAPSSILSGSTYYYTGNGVAGATNTGWWARKLDNSTTSPTCTEVLYSFFHSLPATTKCWQVDGRATIGQSTREVRMLLTTNDVQTTTIFTPTYTPTTNLVPTTGQQVTTVTVTSTNTVNDYGSWGFGTFSSGQATGSCYTISGNGGISEPVYTPGNLCLTGNGFIHQNTSGNVTLYVKGTLSTSSNSFAGTSTSKLTSATVGACTSGGSAVICSSGASSHLYANTYFSSGGTINKPTVSLASVYASADPGPNHPCSVAAGSTASSTWPTFDTNTTRDNSVGSTASPFTSTSYTCKTATGGNISWNATTHVFTITGTVFIDGNLSFAGTTSAVIQGRGTIYTTGTIGFSGQANICESPTSGSPCLGNYDANQNLLVFAAYNNGSHTTTGFTLTGQNTFEGIAFTNGVLSEGGNATLHGPVLADTATMAGNGDTRTIINPPPGAPGAAYDEVVTESGTDTAAWADVPGSWQQLK